MTTGNGELGAANPFMGNLSGGGDGMMMTPGSDRGRQDLDGRRLDESVRAASQSGSRWDSGDRPSQPSVGGGVFENRSFAQSVMKMKQSTEPRKIEFEVSYNIYSCIN